MNKLISLTIITWAVLIVIGCSSRTDSTVTPGETIDPFTISNENISNGNYQQWGIWTASIDTVNFRSEIYPERDLSSHMNITSLIPAPQIYINYFNPSTGIVDVDMLINNPYPIEGRDVRLIIYTDSAGHKLINEDGWTALFDIAGGLPINPFKAVAIDNPSRRFMANSSEIVNLQIHLPGGNSNVKFSIEVSYPLNCNEPYEISNFTHGVIYAETGSNATADVTVKDWQNDVKSVSLLCPDLSGSLFTFEQVTQDNWKGEISNTNATSEGIHSGYILTNSYDSGSVYLYDLVQIEVTRGGGPINPHIVSSINMLAGCKDVVVRGEYAYVADDWGSLKIFSLSNLHNPDPIAHINYGILNSIALVDNYLYLGGEGTFSIVDITDPVNPVLVGELSYGANDMVVVGGYAYLVDHAYLRIVDISDPSNPNQLSSTIFSTYGLTSIAVKDEYAYITHSEDQLYIINIADRTHPVKLFSIGHGYSAEDVEISGNYAYVAAGSQGMKVVSIIQPNDAYVVSEIYTGSNVYEITIIDSSTIACKSWNGLNIIDVSDPFNPDNLSELPFEGEAFGSCVDNGYLFLTAGESGFLVIDIGALENPSLTGSYSYIQHPRNVLLNGNYAFIGTEEYLQVVDVTNPETPMVVGEASQKARSGNMVIQGDYLYMAALQYYFQIFNISQPENPVHVTTISVDDLAYDVCVRDNYAYVIDSDDMNIIDVTDPEQPVNVSQIVPDGPPRIVDLYNDYAFIGGVYRGISIVNISDPAAPSLVDLITTDNPVGDLAIDGHYIYAVTQLSTGSLLYVIDIADPVSPVVTSMVEVPYYPWAIKKSGNYVYIAEGDSGLYIYDVTDPDHAVLFNQLATSGFLIDVDVSGNYVYLVESGKGLDIAALR